MTDSPLALELDTDRTRLYPGEAPNISVRLANRSGRPLWVAGVLEGSEAGLRFPHWKPFIEGPGVGQPDLFMDPLSLTPLLPEILVPLRPGQSLDPQDHPFQATGYFPIVAFREFCPQQEGTYTLWLEYDTRAASPQDWLLNRSLPIPNETLRRIESVEKLLVRSNSLVFQVS